MRQTDQPNKPEKRFFLAQKMTYMLLAVILFLYGLIAIRDFLYPIAFGFLLAYLLFPIVNWLEKKSVPRILANLITIIGVLSILVGGILFAYSKLQSIVTDLPALADTAVSNISDSAARIGEYFGFERSETRQIIQDQFDSFLESGGEYLQEIFSSTASTAVTIGLLPVYIFLFLFYRTKFAYFLLKIVHPSRKKEMVAILREISKVAGRYMGGVIIVVFILCFINSLGLYIIGSKYSIALGIISALFNFIPYFGTLLGGLVPLLFAFFVENDPVLAFRVIILFIIIQFTENNILTPNIVGGNVKVNPFFIITGLVGASIIWGIPGMLLIVPFLAIIRIIFSHIDSMKPFAYLLGQEGTSKHSITVQKITDLWPKAKSIFSRKKDKQKK
ncbi:MAG: AI-2E family transporter [Bacteroidota bacterium]